MRRSLLPISFAALAFSTAARADVSISNKPTQNMSCDARVCTATAQKAVLNVSDLQTMLGSGDVAVKTGVVAKDIILDQPLTWVSTSRLTLDAQQSIIVKKPMSVTGTGALTITTNDGGSGGDLLFSGKGNVTFWDTSSSLIINGASYTLVGDIKTLAAEIAATPDGSYALAKSYDAANDRTYKSSPIRTEFAGTFSGMGNAISNVAIRTSDDLTTGFFSSIAESGHVRDFGLQHAKISTSAGRAFNVAVGILAGENRGIVSSSFASGSINVTPVIEEESVGGLVGRNLGRIIASHANAKVTAGGSYYNYVGGLVGVLDGSTSGNAVVVDSYASGRVESSQVGSAGGLVGENFQATITRSHATGAVIGGQESWVGGLVGLNAFAGYINSSFANGPVTTGSGRSPCYASAGGLVGIAGESITNSYATGSVSGDQACVGGLLGRGGITLTSSYSIGPVLGGAGAEVGGIIGREKAKFARFSDSYWDVDTSGTTQAVGNTNKHHGLKDLSTEEFTSHLPRGFDRNIWGQSPSINNGYPYLLANPPR